jgi:predicted glycoside hydrolase/deacetylase ChbG (UPF0249 family)
MARARLLIVNADDFGFTRDVNEGIVEAHRSGILTATTLMANGPEFDHAVELARRVPSLDIGAHLVLIGGESLARPGRALPASIGQLVKAVALGRIPIYEELDAQVRRIASAGIAVTHLDTHKHTHLLPQVLDVVARLSVEHAIRWVRRPLNVSLLTRRLRRSGCLVTDRFEGFAMTGKFHTREMVAFLENAPPGLTEFMCHPGYCTAELRSAPTRLKESRQRELEALIAPETRAAVERSGVRLVNYRNAGASPGHS